MMREEMIGKQLGNLTLHSKLGHGRLGRVYKAKDADQPEKEWVAVKLIHAQLLQNRAFIEQLPSDWRAFSRPQTTDAIYYRLDEFAPQFSLGHYIRQLKKENASKEAAETHHRFSLTAALTIVFQLLETQLPHGGIHPNNLLVSWENGRSPCYHAPSLTSLLLNDAGQAQLLFDHLPDVVTPKAAYADYYWEHYLKPPLLLKKQIANCDQQLKDAYPSAAPDIFALGMLLFDLLLGHHPHLPNAAEALATIQPVAEHETATAIQRQNSEIIRNYLKKLCEALVEGLPEIEGEHENPLSNEMSQADLASTAELQTLLVTMICGVQAEVVTENENTKKESKRVQLEEPQRWVDVEQIRQQLVQLSPVGEVGLQLPVCLPMPPTEMPLGQKEEDDDVSKRPFSNPIYIITQLPNSSNGTTRLQSLFPQIYEMGEEQDFLMVGHLPICDIVLPYAQRVAPYQLEIRQTNDGLEVRNVAAGGDERSLPMLGNNPLSPHTPTLWPASIALRIDDFELHWRQEVNNRPTQGFEAGLLPEKLSIFPGIQKQIGLAIHNNGRRGYFTARLLPPDNDNEVDDTQNWLTLLHEGVLLDQGQQRELTLIVAPPIGTTPKKYRFKLEVERFDHDGEGDEEKLLLKKEPKGEIIVEETDVVPQFVTHQLVQPGLFEISLENLSGESETYLIHSDQMNPRLKFAIHSTRLTAEGDMPEDGADYKSLLHQYSRTQLFFRRLPLIGRFAQRRLTPRPPMAMRQLRLGQNRAKQLGALTQIWGEGQDSNQTGNGQLAENFTPPPSGAFMSRLQYEISLKTQTAESMMVWVMPSKRPFRYDPPSEIPFSLTIIPPNNRPAVTKRLALQTRSRLSRLQWLLLCLLLGTLCLSLTVGAAYWLNQQASVYPNLVPTAVQFSQEDDDEDGLTNKMEHDFYQTDPQNPDTDGDTILDGTEVRLKLNPLLVDSDGDGIPDNVEIRVATVTPMGGENDLLLTPQPTVTPTLRPTITPSPTVTPAPIQTTEPFTVTTQLADEANAPETLLIGDTAEYEGQLATLSFSLEAVPAEATLGETRLILVLDSPYQPAVQALGPLYAAAVSQLPPSDFSLATDAEIERYEVMQLNEEVLMATFPEGTFQAGETAVIQLAFFPISNRDSRTDTLTIILKRQGQHAPTLFFDATHTPVETKP